MMTSSYFKKAFGNSFWIITSKVVGMLVGFITNIYITRYLGVEQKGVMAKAQAIASFWAFFSTFCLTDILISKFSKDKEKSGSIAATGMLIILGSGFLSFVLGIISAICLKTSKETLLYVAVIGFVYVFEFLCVYDCWFYSNSNSKLYAISQSVIHIIFLLIKYLGVPLNLGILYFVSVSTIELIVSKILLYVIYKTIGCRFIGELKFDKEIAKNIMVLALPMIVTGLATAIYTKIDQVMLGEMMGDEELGFYSVAVSLVENWYFIPPVVYSSFLPSITESVDNHDKFKSSLQIFADIMAVIGYAAAIGYMLFGRFLITKLYGLEFERSTYMLFIYVWSGLFICLSYSGQAYYIVLKDTKTIMWINIFGAIINFALNYYLINVLGGIGAALATLLGYLIISFGQMIVLRKKYGELYIIQIKSLFPFFRVLNYFLHGKNETQNDL